MARKALRGSRGCELGRAILGGARLPPTKTKHLTTMGTKVAKAEQWDSQARKDGGNWQKYWKGREMMQDRIAKTVLEHSSSLIDTNPGRRGERKMVKGEF